MPLSRIDRRTIAIGAVVTALSLAGLQAASAETEVFKDVLRPHGVARGLAQKDADSRACGGDSGGRFDNVPAFERCMRQHGWAVATIKPNAAERAMGGTFYDDMTGQSRSEAALHVDTRACNPAGRLLEGSPIFARCMTSHGWRLSFSLPVPHARTYAGGPSRSSSSNDEERRNDEAARNDESRRQLQDSIDTTNANNAAAAAAAQAFCGSPGSGC